MAAECVLTSFKMYYNMDHDLIQKMDSLPKGKSKQDVIKEALRMYFGTGGGNSPSKQTPPPPTAPSADFTRIESILEQMGNAYLMMAEKVDKLTTTKTESTPQINIPSINLPAITMPPITISMPPSSSPYPSINHVDDYTEIRPRSNETPTKAKRPKKGDYSLEDTQPVKPPPVTEEEAIENAAGAFLDMFG